MELDTRRELRRDVTSLYKNYELFKDYNLSEKVAFRYLNYLENLNRLLYEVSISLDPYDKKTNDYSKKCVEMINFFRSKSGNLDSEAYGNDSSISMNSSGNTSTLSENEIQLRNEIDELNLKLEQRNIELIKLKELNDQLLNSQEDSREQNIRIKRESYLDEMRSERGDKNSYLNTINRKSNQQTNRIDARNEDHKNQIDSKNEDHKNQIDSKNEDQIEETIQYNQNVSKLLNIFQKTKDEQAGSIKNEKIPRNKLNINSSDHQISKSNDKERNQLKITESFRSKELNLVRHVIKSEDDKIRSKINEQKIKLEETAKSSMNKIYEDGENSINVQKLIEFYEELNI